MALPTRAGIRPERLSNNERRELSRRRILDWHSSSRSNKFTQLSNTVKGSNSRERMQMERHIRRNTKRELLRTRGLSEAQRAKRAKEFAAAIMKAAATGGNIQDVARKFSATNKQESTKNCNELAKEWMNQSGEKRSDSLLETCFFKIKSHKRAKEMYLLLKLMSKYWPASWPTKAKALFAKAEETAKPDKQVNFTPFEKFFSEANAGPILGFYFSSNKGKWYAADVKDHGKGQDETDEAGGEYLVDSIDLINREFRADQAGGGKHNDSGIAIETQKDISALLGAGVKEAKARLEERDKGAPKLLGWFKSKANQKWMALDEKMFPMMVAIYGANCGQYLYRYEPAEKKIYMVAMKNGKVSGNETGGHIEIKNNKILKDNRHLVNGASLTKVFQRLIDKKKPNEVYAELTDLRIASGNLSRLSHAQKLDRTVGIAAIVGFASKKIEYADREDKYFKPLEKKLSAYLVKKYKGTSRALNQSQAEVLTKVRINHMRDVIRKKVQADDAIRQALESNSREKIVLRTNSRDEVTVALGNSALYASLRTKASKSSEAVTSAATMQQKAMEKLEAKVRKYAGPFAPVVMYLLNSVFKIKKELAKLAGGKSSMIGSALLAGLGVSLGKERIGSIKMNKEKFKKFLKKEQNKKAFKKKTFFDEAVTLKEVKIVIPKGKGFKPGSEMDVEIPGGSPRVQKAYPGGQAPLAAGKKKKFSAGGFMRMFRSRWKKWSFKNKQIVIPEGTVIPQGTILPKGAEVIRT